MEGQVRVTPKDFFLWIGAMIALYWSVVAFILLFFNYINYALPNGLTYLSDPYSSSIPYEMSSIVVLFPTFLVLMLFIRRDIGRDPTRKNIWIRRWALVLTLFLAGLSSIIDVITLLTAFFRGEELTEAFLLKVLIVLFVSAVAFMHFIADFWGYWQLFPKRNRAVLWSVSLLAALSILAGFFIVGTPWQARLYRFDGQRVSDLQTLQSQIVSYWQAKQQLPAALTDLEDSIQGFSIPNDPATGAPYEYRRMSTLSFELCATFGAPTPAYASAETSTVPYVTPGPLGGTWYHGGGVVCFDRTIDPQLYPPFSKTQQPPLDY